MKRKFVSVLTSIALVAVLAPPAFSTTSVPSFETELTQADFVGFRHFGAAVAIDGDTAVVGVPQDPQAGFDSGSVYIYVRIGSQWSQQAKLIAADPAPSSKFGSAVAISGDTVVVGAPFRMNGSLKTGAAYVFVRSDSAWTQQTKLSPTDGIGDDAFGSAVTVEADTLAVGAFGTGLAGIGFPGEGAVYVFTRNATAWSQRARLRSDVPGTGNWFGFSLALDHGTLAIGSPTDDDLLLADAGAVYVYTGSGATWNLQDELTASDAAAGDRLGWSVALSGDTLLAGAPQNHSGASFAGAAYAFVRAGADWSQEKKLVAADSAMLDCFGYSVALVNNTAIVGSVLDSSFAPSAGSAYVFTRSGGAWSQNSEFSAGDIERDFRFGYSVALSGTTIFVGAPFGTFFQEGAAYLYELTSSNTGIL